MAAANSNGLTTLGASFATDIAQLGANGFAEWLIQSFGGKEPRHKYGHFHYDDNIPFFEVFHLVADELPADVLELAKSGADRALSEFDLARGTFRGLMELTGTAEALGLGSFPDQLAAIFNDCLPPNGSWKKPIDTLTDIIAFRETLESAYRALWAAITKREFASFKRISHWAFELLWQSPQPQLVPAYAPLYILARAHLAFENERAQPNQPHIKALERLLKNGAMHSVGPFSSLYIYESSAYPIGRFPYRIEQLISLGAQTAQGINREVLPHFSLSEMVQEADPMAHWLAQATTGTAPRPADAHRRVDELVRELESA